MEESGHQKAWLPQASLQEGVSAGGRPRAVTNWAQPRLGHQFWPPGPGPRPAGVPAAGRTCRYPGAKLEGCPSPQPQVPSAEIRYPGVQGRGPTGHCLAGPQHLPLRGAVLPRAALRLPPRPPVLRRSTGRREGAWLPEQAPSPEKGKTQRLPGSEPTFPPPHPASSLKGARSPGLQLVGKGDSAGISRSQGLTSDLQHALWCRPRLSLRLGCHIPQGPQTSPTSG